VRKAIVFSVAAVSCVFAQGDPRAQALSDPMRPPEASAAARGQASSSGLQAVITSPQRKLAVIDGAVVPLGAPVRGATLDGVSDSLAVLKKDGERDVLLMHPQIDKKRRSNTR
jgi:MSHA biogenesis protein MshK